MRARTGAAAMAAAVGLIVAGCGSSGAGTSTTLGGAASLAPSNAAAFVALDSDVSSDQWRTYYDLLEQFPQHDELIAGLKKTFEQRTKLNWDDDVEPALGSELDLIELPGKQPALVGLTQSSDQAKLHALLRKLDKGIVSQQIQGWTAFSSSQDALDTVTGATTKLADNNTYRAAVAKLAGDALVHAYANGTEAQELLTALGKQTPAASTPPFAWASADVVASGDGVRVSAYSHDGSMRGVQPRFRRTPSAPYASTLVDEIPAGALFVADLPITPGQFQFSDPSERPKAIQKLLVMSPTFLAELDDLLGGETALYVRQGLPIPEVTIVTQPSDTALAVRSLADVLVTLRKQRVMVGGIDLAKIPVVHDVVGGQLIISTSPQGIADFRSAGAKLSSDSTFKSAVEASSMPAQTTGFLYVNLASALPVVDALGPLLGLNLPPALTNSGDALKSLIAYGTRAGDDATFKVFLQTG